MRVVQHNGVLGCLDLRSSPLGRLNWPNLSCAERGWRAGVLWLAGRWEQHQVSELPCGRMLPAGGPRLQARRDERGGLVGVDVGQELARLLAVPRLKAHVLSLGEPALGLQVGDLAGDHAARAGSGGDDADEVGATLGR